MRAMLLLLAAGCSASPVAERDSRDKPKGPVLLFFVGTECPVSNFYAPEMERLAGSGARAELVYSEPGVTEEGASRHAAEYRLTAARSPDPDLSIAARYGVTRIPTAVLLHRGEIVYRGRIDDRYTPEGKRRADVRSRDLEAAIGAVLSGRKPELSETPVFGCPLALKKASK